MKKTGRGKKGRVGPPKIVSLTSDLEAVTGEGERDEVLKELVVDQEREQLVRYLRKNTPSWDDLPPAKQQELIALVENQYSDKEPSPLDPSQTKNPKISSRNRM